MFFIECIGNMVDSFIIIDLLSTCFESKYTGRNKILCKGGSFLFLSVYLSILTQFPSISNFKFISFILLTVFIAHFIFFGSFFKMLMIGVMYGAFLLLMDILVINAVNLLLGVNHSMMNASENGLFRMICLLICKSLLIILYFLVRRWIQLQKKYPSNFLKWIGVIGFLNFISVYFLYYLNLFDFLLQMQYVLLFLDGLIFLMNGVTILCFYLYAQQRKSKETYHLIHMENTMLDQNYKKLQETYQSHAKALHDVQNHFYVLYNLIQSGKSDKALSYIKTFTENLQHANIIYTGNQIVDAILFDKSNKAKSANIVFDIEGTFPENPKIDSLDICAILSNLLDNAIEACEQIPEPDMRRIKWKSNYTKEYILIQIQNTVDKNPLLDNKHLHTVKKNPEMHGWGLKSVRESIEKYKGNITFEYKCPYFNVSVLLQL